MLSDEEKKAIENMKSLLLYSKEHEYFSPFQEQEIDDMNIVLNIVEKQSKEIEHQIEKRANQKKELAILNAKQIEFNKLVNTVNSYKGQFKRQQKEIEELKEKDDANLSYYDQIYQNGIYTGQKAVEDKIKAKIEERQKRIEQLHPESDCVIIDDLETEIAVLQSLLEKE